MKSSPNCYCQKEEAGYNSDNRTYESEHSDARSFEYGIVLGYRARSALHAPRPYNWYQGAPQLPYTAGSAI